MLYKLGKNPLPTVAPFFLFYVAKIKTQIPQNPQIPVSKKIPNLPKSTISDITKLFEDGPKVRFALSINFFEFETAPRI